MGDAANKGGFDAILYKWRELLKECDHGTLGRVTASKISKKKLAGLLVKGDPAYAGLVHSAVEEFGQELFRAIMSLLRRKEWKGTECVVIGGGFQASQIGRLAVGRCELLLREENMDVGIQLFHHDPDHAGLIGAVHLLPSWMLKGHDALLAVDIGGTNIRAGVIRLNLKKAASLSKASVAKLEHWRHAEGKPTRDQLVARLMEMLERLWAWSKRRGMRLAPVVGVGCLGTIRKDGSILRGGENLPGNWQSRQFNLPDLIHDPMPKIGKHETTVIMHNDAVVQGLSELPRVKRRPFHSRSPMVATLTLGCSNNRNWTGQCAVDEPSWQEEARISGVAKAFLVCTRLGQSA